MTPAKKLASHRFLGVQRGETPLKRGVQRGVPLNPRHSAERRNAENFKWFSFLYSGSLAGMTSCPLQKYGSREARLQATASQLPSFRELSHKG